jgi:copper homeostasis protein CutC
LFTLGGRFVVIGKALGKDHIDFEAIEKLTTAFKSAGTDFHQTMKDHIKEIAGPKEYITQLMADEITKDIRLLFDQIVKDLKEMDV